MTSKRLSNSPSLLTDALEALPNHVCPLCGGANQCAPAKAGSLDVACWCTKAEISPQAIARIPAELVNKACLCPRCASGLNLPDIQPAAPVE